MIEGEWTGYRSSQQRVAHRHYTASKKEAESVESIGYGITYTDGTTLILRVVEVKGRKKLPVIDSYRSLINDCRLAGVSSVQALIDRREAAAINKEYGR
jgi:hypothetical protein